MTAIFPNLLDLTRRAASAEARYAQGSALAEVARQWFSKAETAVTTIPLASQDGL